MRKVFALLLVFILVFSLTACGGRGTVSEKTIHSLVQGNLDAIYLGKVTDEYLMLVDTTSEKSKKNYLDGLESEAEFFCHYFGIIDSEYDETFDDIDDEVKDIIIDIYKQIYDQSKYVVGEATKQDDGNYVVDVTIAPIDIMDKALDTLISGTYGPYEDFLKKYASVDVDEISDEEVLTMLLDYNTDYQDVIINLITELLPTLGYRNEKTVSVHVEKDEDGFYSINQDDWNKIDDYMIYYP